MKVKEESEKPGLKINVQKTKIMASSHIISWHMEREKVETMAEFIFLAPKALWTVNGSHENKRRLLLRKKAMINLEY